MQANFCKIKTHCRLGQTANQPVSSLHQILHNLPTDRSGDLNKSVLTLFSAELPNQTEFFMRDRICAIISE